MKSVSADHAQQHYLPAHFAESGYAVFEIPKLFSAPDTLLVEFPEQRDARIAVVFFKLKQNCLAGVLFEKTFARIYSICGGEVGGFLAALFFAVRDAVNGDKLSAVFQLKAHVEIPHADLQLLFYC